MAGTLTKTTNGLILAEPCDVAPASNGWTVQLIGTTASAVVVSNETAHSGSNSYDFQLATDWGPAAYITISKNVTIPVGGNPLIRCFRGLANVKGAAYDDFLGSSLKYNRWSGSCISVGNSIAILASSLAAYEIYSVSAMRPGPGTNTIRWAALIMVGPSTNGSGANVMGPAKYNPPGGPGDAPRVDWGESYNGDYRNHYVDAGNNLLATIAYPDTSFHIYEFEWHYAAYPNGVITFWKDGTQEATATGAYVPNDSANNKLDLYGDSGHKTDFQIDWVSVSTPGAYVCSLTLGSQGTLFSFDPTSDYSTGGGPWKDQMGGWVAVTATGSQALTIKVNNTSSSLITFPAHMFIDDLVIMLDKTVKILGLLGGQKVEFYNSGGTLVYSGSTTLTGQTLTLTSDITPNISTAYGLLGYFKVYDTNGTTLLYTSPAVTLWGGDVYTWLTNASSTVASASQPQVYVNNIGLSPTTATITATLTDASSHAGLSGRTIVFTPNLGSCSPASATTNSSGVATTTFTSGPLAGLGGVRCDFFGDATYGPSSAQVLISVYGGQAAVKVDPTKGFQAFLNGVEIIIASGNYMLATDFKPQSFQVVTPETGTSVGGWQVLQIYRFGVLEFQGTILGTKRQSGTTPQLIITGLDNKVLLQRRVVNAGYTDDPKNIINSLLTAYPCGVTAGTLSTFGNSITIDASYEILFDALAQVQSITGWAFRLNNTNTLDFAPSFGLVQPITITLGQNAILTDYEIDWSQLDTSLTAVGAGTGASLLTASVTDPASTLIYGLIETVSLQKSITDQGGLNLAAAQTLSQKDVPRVTLTVDFADVHPTLSYGLWDFVTVVDPVTGLSGQYQIASIKRDLTNGNFAELVLTNVVISIADLLALLRANVKDLSL